MIQRARPASVKKPKTARKAPRSVKLADPPSIDRSSKLVDRIQQTVAEMDRLQEARLVVERKLAAHTGIFGSGWLKMSDPENESLLASLDAQIDEATTLLQRARAALALLKDSLTQAKQGSTK